MEDKLENILEGINIPETLPLVPIRDIVIFPYMILPLYVGRETSIAAVDEAAMEWYGKTHETIVDYLR